MKYYLGNNTDPLFAVYAAGGVCHPVFVEKYGEACFAFRPDMQEITDAETVAALDKYIHPYEDGKVPVYMAGPLFNEGDRYTNQLNSDRLRAAGYTTFLPQEIVITNKSSVLVKAACYYMDLKAIRLCSWLVVNCNGIEIDSGTAAEIGLGYGWGKKLALYKSDVRNYYNESFRLNNFVGGLVDNRVYKTIDEILAVMAESGK
ncbi:MAG: nucleoside 2-deoxyribosyltransferase [Oscillospiraceae bacterium]|nr:nucleoside 2-deoxyribosyltransferase [Oscillospiraceae bacterium]